MLIPPIEISANYDKQGNMYPDKRAKLLKKGWTEEEISQAEDRAREALEEVNEARTKIRDRGIARSGLDISEQLSEGYLDLEDLI
ncbi:hypothetical protein [Crocosphaera chwakensis]|nr:hypothetical protein [Crocosphaera chwakensis]